MLILLPTSSKATGCEQVLITPWYTAKQTIQTVIQWQNNFNLHYTNPNNCTILHETKVIK